MEKFITTVLGEKVRVDDYQCFVTMTDKFMSGWGCASGKIAKRVYPCKNSRIAYELRDRILSRNSGMIYVNVVFSLPYYSSSRYVVSFDLGAEKAFRY